MDVKYHRGIYRLNRPSFNDYIPWEIFDKYKTGVFIPFIGYNIFKEYPSTAWHVETEAQTVHSKKFRIKKSICDNDLKEFSIALKDVDLEKVIDLEKNITPLILACKFNRVEMVKYLIMKGADINYPDLMGRSPLMYAVESMSFDVIKLLVENGADILKKDNFNISPLDKAEIKKYNSIVFYLKENLGEFRNPDLGKFIMRTNDIKDLEFILEFIDDFKIPQFDYPIVYPFNNLKGIYLMSLVNKNMIYL